MNLSAKDKHLLFALQFWGPQSLAKLAAKMGMRESTLRSKITRWESQGAIAQRVFIDTFLVGATEVELFFSPAKSSKSAQARLTQAVMKAPGVRWFYRTAGKHEFIVGLEALHINQLVKHLEDLDGQSTGIFAGRDMGTSIGYWWFGRKYLAPEGTKHVNCLASLPTKKHLTIDDTDHRILQVLGHRGAQSLRGLAQDLDMPQSTIGYRINALQKSGVIIGFPYLISSNWLGMNVFRLQLTFSTFAREIHAELLAWCRQHPSIVSMMRLLGAWDYTLRCEVKNSQELTELTDQLHDRFGHALQECSVVSVIKELSFSYYPLERFAE